MEVLLRNDFTAHYGLPVAIIVNISATTSAPYFELKDDNILVYTTIGLGFAKYSNVNTKNITVINYEKFFNSISHKFIQGNEKCDLIVHDNNQQYFLLNELTDTLPLYVEPYVNTYGNQPGKRQKAISQMLSSLKLLMDVPSIAKFIQTYKNRQCCFFNKQTISPPTITAAKAFSRLSTLTNGGLNTTNPHIEAFGFEFWEYSGEQIYTL